MKAEIIFTAMLQLQPPSDDPAEWMRYATIAVAFEQAVDEQLARGWGGTRVELERSGLTAMRFESRFARSVHSGEKRSVTGAICLGQINPTNELWRKFASSFEELAGVGYRATLTCLRVMLASLANARSYCRKRRWIRNWSPAMWRVYATGHSCQPSRHSWKRARFAQGIVFSNSPEPGVEELIRDVVAADGVDYGRTK